MDQSSDESQNSKLINDLRENRLQETLNTKAVSKQDPNKRQNIMQNKINEKKNISKVQKTNPLITPEILVFFRRGLRIQDHTAINAAIEVLSQANSSNSTSSIMCLFNFDPVQVDTELNSQRSERSIKQMIESLEEIDSDLKKRGSKLQITYGSSNESLENVLKEVKTIKKVFCHKDVTPFSIDRDEKLQQICKANKVQFESFWDDFLVQPGTVKSNTDTQYKIFKPFYEKSKIIPQSNVQQLNDNNYFCAPKKYNFEWNVQTDFNSIQKYLKISLELDNLQPGGRSSVIERFESGEYKSNMKKYGEYRDIPHEKTSYISAALKFGVISIREAMNIAMSGDYSSKPKKITENALTRQLQFRDFYQHVTQTQPHVLENKCFQLHWENQDTKFDQKLWDAWCTGMTGVPLVDAGMRQLLATGYMSNRVRMLTASLLNKNMNIAWKMGEKFFARHLMDYDPSLNNGGWQSTCGMGASALEYFRVMNPFTQGEKFDKECNQIKRWIPELKNVSNKTIHQWADTYKLNENKNVKYPAPVVEISTSRTDQLDRTKKWIAKYQNK